MNLLLGYQINIRITILLLMHLCFWHVYMETSIRNSWMIVYYGTKINSLCKFKNYTVDMNNILSLASLLHKKIKLKIGKITIHHNKIPLWMASLTYSKGMWMEITVEVCGIFYEQCLQWWLPFNLIVRLLHSLPVFIRFFNDREFHNEFLHEYHVPVYFEIFYYNIVYYISVRQY